MCQYLFQGALTGVVMWLSLPDARPTNALEVLCGRAGSGWPRYRGEHSFSLKLWAIVMGAFTRFFGRNDVICHTRERQPDVISDGNMTRDEPTNN